MNQAAQQAIPSGTDVAALRQLIMGFRSSQMIYVAAKLELADRLDQCPRTAADLAADVGAEPRALYRLMRALASIGIFAEGEGQTFALTPAARLLQRNASRHSIIATASRCFPIIRRIRRLHPCFTKR